MYALAIMIVLLIVIWVCLRGKEKFSDKFLASPASTETLQYVDMGDHRTMVRLQRGNSGKTVLLLHNTPMNSELWLPLFQELQKTNMSGIKTPTIVAYDLRGHGTAWMPVDTQYDDSNINNVAWSLDTFVDDCRKIYDTVIGDGKIKVCGFGFGGIIAQKYALKYPETVEKLILLQTSIRPMAGHLDTINKVSDWILKNPGVSYLTGQEQFVKDTLCDWFFLPKDYGCTPEDIVGQQQIYGDEQNLPAYNLTAWLWRQGSVTTALQAYKIMASTNLQGDWEETDTPPFTVHILTAVDDPLSPTQAMTETYAAIYNVNRTLLVVFDVVEGRHGFTIARPDYIAGIICDDCEKISATATYHPQN